ncbi:MAG: hypothetical protein O7H41_19135 [Planctomycetota bacterium]|nr:hypothetical protein [Planctomycetota bacterium]
MSAPILLQGKSRSVLVLIAVVLIGGLWAWRPMRTKALIRSYARAVGGEKQSIHSDLRAHPASFGRGIAWGIRTKEFRAAAMDLIDESAADEFPAAPVAGAAADMFRSDDAEDREAAGKVFALLGQRGTTELQVALSGMSDMESRSAALGHILEAGDAGQDAVARYYISLFRSPEVAVRKRSRLQLRDLGPSASMPLIEGLRDGNVWVRLFCPHTLADRGEKRAVLALIQGLGDSEPDTGVKVAIGDALLRITGFAGRAHHPDLWRAWWKDNQHKYPPQILP